jgi:phage replication O-like protein O
LASPQKENGFTPIANEILEACMGAKFNGTQFKIIIALWRYTYGFKRKEHDFSLTYLAKATGIHKQTIKRELDKLIEQKVILVVSECSFTSSRILAFNKDYEQWSLQSAKTYTVSELAYSTVSGLTDSTVSELAYQERNIKENIKESSSSNEVFDFYHKNIQVGISSSPYVYQKIDGWIEDIGCDLVLAAMKLAATKEKRGFDYTEGILKKWTQAGVKTIEDARKHELEFKNKKAPRKKEIDWEEL